MNSVSVNPNVIPAQCAATSVGAGAQFLLGTINALVASFCAISPPSLWPKDYGPYLQDGDEFDFIVIGGGTAGNIVATRLSECSKFKVLVLELGGDPPFESEATNMFLFMTKSRVVIPFYERTKHCCRSDPKGCYWPRGKMLGGSSGIGFMLWLRGCRKNWHDIAAMGNPSWDYDGVLPFFKKSENMTNRYVVELNPWLHGTAGPSKAEYGNLDALGTALYQALIDSGQLMTPDHNLPDSRGYGHIPTGSYNGTRYSSARAYLVPNKNRRNLYIVKHCFVTKILMKGKEAIGVEYKYKNQKKRRAYARREVIVSAGSFSSVGVLMRSGIGPAAELKKNKIECKVDTPVGRNLIEHSYVHLVFSVNYSTTCGNPNTGSYDYIYDFLMHNSGPFSTLPYTSGHFNAFNISDYPNYQRYFTSFPCGSPPYYKNFCEFFSVGVLNKTCEAINKHSDLLIVTICMSQPKSRGYVTLDKDPLCNKVKIHSNLLQDPYDREVYVRAIRQTFELFQNEPFRKMNVTYHPYPYEECDAMGWDTDNYWDCIAQYQSSCGSHPCGTSRMGPASDPASVCDERGRFHKVKRLRQCDAGLIPHPLNVNTVSNVHMLGEKISSWMQEEYKCPA